MSFIVNTKSQVIILIFSFVLSAFSFASIINFTDPFTASKTIFVFFYLNLFLLVFSGVCLTALVLKRWFWPKMFLLDFASSLRQGLLLGFFFTVAVLLQINGLLFWWLEITMLILLVFLELLFTIK
jgi:hypothetical protein